MKNILCYGDSNTFGWDPDHFVRFAPDVRWPGVLANELGPEFHIIEEGCGGRTTVVQDGLEPFVSGARYLEPCLRSHTPLDAVVFMLGTNDLKNRYSLSALDIGNGMATLCSIVHTTLRFEQDELPKILVLSPVHIGEGVDAIPDISEMFGHGPAYENSRRLADRYRAVAYRYGCDFFDVSTVAKPSRTDCIHLDAAGHRAIGLAVAEVICDFFPKTVLK